MVASLLAAYDDSTNYGGKARATYNLLSTVVAGGSGALTAAFMVSAYEPLRIGNRVKPLDDVVIMSSFEQIQAYTEIVGIQYSEQNYNWDADSRGWDIGKIRPRMAYNGVPWFDIPTITNTNVVFGRTSDMVVVIKRPLTYKMLGAVDDSDQVLVSMGMELQIRDPQTGSKIEALST